MKRRILPLLLALALILGLYGCGSDGGTLDMQTLAEDGLKTGGFSHAMWYIDDTIGQNLNMERHYNRPPVSMG